MASGMVPIWMLDDPEVGAAEVLVYLAVSSKTPTGLSVDDLARVSKSPFGEALKALLRLLERGLVEEHHGRFYLGPLGGGSR